MLVRTFLSVGRNGNQDQAGVPLFQLLISDSPAVQGSRLEGLQNKISPGKQPKKETSTSRSVQVQRNATFVGIACKPGKTLRCAVGALQQRWHAPGRIALGRFNLNDVGTQVG